jgi:hypothetical protein
MRVSDPVSRAMAALLVSALLALAIPASMARAESMTAVDGKSMQRPNEKGLARSPAGAPGGTTRVVRVGDKSLIVPLPEGYVAMEDLDPQVRGLFEDTKPAGMLLLDVLLHAEDLNLEPSEYGRHVSLEFYTKQGMENVELDAKSWAQAKPVIAGTLRRIDLSSKLADRDDRINGAFAARFGDGVRFEQGKPGEQVVYRQDERTIRMYLVLPMQQTLDGETYQVEEVRLVALTRMRSRMVGVGASLEFPAGKVDIGEAVKQLDAFVDALLELNPGT